MNTNFIVRGVSVDGCEFFYTGRAGEGWISENRADAFAYGVDGARRKAAIFNKTAACHGLRFVAVPQNGYDQNGEAR